jgi:hypothetical protein
VVEPEGQELANYAADTVAEVADQARHGIQRVCDSDSLVMGSSPTPACRSTTSRHPKAKGSIRRRAAQGRSSCPTYETGS